MNRLTAVLADAFSDPVVRCATGFLTVALALLAWYWFAGTGASDTRFTHMHCAICEEELPYKSATAGMKCPSCGREDGDYVATVGSFREGKAAMSLGTRIFLFVLLAGVAGQSLAYVAVLRLRARRRALAEALTRKLVCRCPYCARKVGFPANKLGHAGICPRCKTAFTFTATEESEAVH